MLEQERHRIEQLTAGWDDPTQVDWGHEDVGEVDIRSSLDRTPSIALKCTALYSYTVRMTKKSIPISKLSILI